MHDRLDTYQGLFRNAEHERCVLDHLSSRLDGIGFTKVIIITCPTLEQFIDEDYHNALFGSMIDHLRAEGFTIPPAGTVIAVIKPVDHVIGCGPQLISLGKIR